jgi:DNA mismatch endonuclease, patch repair protein
MMSAVKQRDTVPEIKVRAILNSLKVTYRTRNRDLPGSPDIANRKRGWAVFVNGCFGHGHRNCKKTKGGKNGRIPVGNRHYWAEKIIANRKRDARKCKEFKKLGFKVLVIWECELADPLNLQDRILQFLKVKSIEGGE